MSSTNDIDAEWRTIPEFPKYQVTRDGRVRNAKTLHVLKPTLSGAGYHVVGLLKDGKQYSSRQISRLVLMAYSPTDNPKLYALHYDGNPLNNNLSNLRWGTNSENFADSVRHGRASILEKHGMAKLNINSVREIRKARKNGASLKSLAEKYGVTFQNISDVVLENIWKEERLDTLEEQSELKARLVELDLFEQFLGQHENKPITRSSLYEYKLQRLKDLVDRLNTLKEGNR